MNRRSPALMMNPAPTGADCVCAWTRGVYIGVPMPEASIATIVTIDHGFAERMRRHVRGLEALISDPRFKKRLSNGLTYESTSQRSTPPVLSRTCRRRTGGAPADDARASPSDRRRGTRLWKRVGSY